MTSIATIAATRFGYGFHPDQALPSDATGLLAELGMQSPVDARLGGPTMRQRAALFAKYFDVRKARRNDLSLTPKMQDLVKRMNVQFRTDIAARVAAPVLSDQGFYERLCWFWTDHFTTAARNNITKSFTPRLEVDAIRPNINTTFGQMLRAVTTHPAMIVYLDQHRSVGPGSKLGRRTGRGLNENLAREIIELHTLGVGGRYAQADVRQFAELLTGLNVNRRKGFATFRRERAEPGSEQVLGEVYEDGEGDFSAIFDALEDMARHPDTARHIARKLAVHFVADDPPQALVDHIASAYQRTEGRLSAVYQALLEHPESWAEPARKVKQPFDYVVSSLRAAGLDRKGLKPFQKGGDVSARKALRSMNQDMMQAPGPDGWPEAAQYWITAQGLASRLQWAASFGRHFEPVLDPRAYLDTALADRARPATRFAATNAAEKWEGLALVLASPEFNRR